jgi:hypothetical protein
MSNDNFQTINNIEAKLMQAQSMVKIILDNHNYQSAGFDKPFIEHCDTGNLLWAIGDLIEDAFHQLGKININKDKNNG